MTDESNNLLLGKYPSNFVCFATLGMERPSSIDTYQIGRAHV